MLFLGSKLKLNLKKNLRNNHLIDYWKKNLKLKFLKYDLLKKQ